MVELYLITRSVILFLSNAFIQQVYTEFVYPLWYMKDEVGNMFIIDNTCISWCITMYENMIVLCYCIECKYIL